MGAQRHLKAIGIFSRLKIRDRKPGYIGDIPRTLAYLRDIAARQPSIADLSRLIETLDIERRFEAMAAA